MYVCLFWPYGGHYGVEEHKYTALKMQDEILGGDGIMRLPMTREDFSPRWNKLNAQSSVPNTINNPYQRHLIKILPPLLARLTAGLHAD